MNAPREFHPTGATLAEAVKNCPEIYPDNGFTFVDMQGNLRLWKFAEVERETARRARGLQDAGLKQGDRLGLIIIEPQDFVLTFLAAARELAVEVSAVEECGLFGEPSLRGARADRARPK